MSSLMMTDRPFAARRPGRYSGLSSQELNLLLRQHTAKTAMAFFDRLSPEQRDMVREGKIAMKGFTWQLQDRDERGRFLPVA